jgi:hypothetical protein
MAGGTTGRGRKIFSFRVYTASTPIRDSWGEIPNLLIFGGPCRGRTCGPLIKSQLLYQLS